MLEFCNPEVLESRSLDLCIPGFPDLGFVNPRVPEFWIRAIPEEFFGILDIEYSQNPGGVLEFCNPGVPDSCCPGFLESANPGARNIGFLVCQNFGFWSLESRSLDFRIVESQCWSYGTQKRGVPVSRSIEFPKSQIPGVLDSRIPGIPESRILGIPESQRWSSNVPEPTPRIFG